MDMNTNSKTANKKTVHVFALLLSAILLLAFISCEPNRATQDNSQTQNQGNPENGTVEDEQSDNNDPYENDKHWELK